FTLKAVVNDDGFGNTVVLEINEDNNSDEMGVDLSEQGLAIVGPTQVCEGQHITLSSNFTDLDVYEWFFNGNPIGGNTSSIEVTETGIYTLQGTRASCYVAAPDFSIYFNPVPVIEESPDDLFSCNNGVGSDVFDLTVNTPVVMGGQDPALFGVKYFETEDDAVNNVNEIGTPQAYQTSAATQTIFVRIFTLAQDECYAIDNFVLHFPYVRAGMVPPLSVCDNEGVGEQQINLPFLFNDQVLDGLNDYQFNITYHSSQADANSGANPLQDDYTLMAPGVTIYARIEPVDFEYCFDTTSIEIILEAPLVNRKH